MHGKIFNRALVFQVRQAFFLFRFPTPKFFHTIFQRALPLKLSLNRALPPLPFLQTITMSFRICHRFLQIIGCLENNICSLHVSYIQNTMDNSPPSSSHHMICTWLFELVKIASCPNGYDLWIVGPTTGRVLLTIKT